MANLHAITKSEFTKKSWKRHTDYFFSANDSVCVLGASELPRAAMGMPLAFVPADGEYSIVGVQGLQQGTNFFVNAEGKWMGNYIPAADRGYPFFLADNTSNKEGQVLCIETDSGLLIDDETEEPFYDEDLEPCKAISDIVDFLSKVNTARQASDRICKILSGHGLLKPWEIEFELVNATQKIGGLFCIDEAALNRLADDAYAELRMAGAIPFIYCQLLSMQRISDLTLLAQKKSKVDFLPQSNQLNFDEVNADDIISFDNL